MNLRLINKKIMSMGVIVVILFIAIYAITRITYSTEQLFKYHDINFDQIIFEEESNYGDLAFFTVSFNETQKGLGLALIDNDWKNEIIVSNSRSLSDKVTWDVLTTKCGRDCESVSILYGAVYSGTEKLKIEIDDEEYWPNLIKTKSDMIWYLPFEQINDIQLIEGYSSNGDIVYSYPDN
jgi:hypothetical protein